MRVSVGEELLVLVRATLAALTFCVLVACNSDQDLPKPPPNPPEDTRPPADTSPPIPPPPGPAWFDPQCETIGGEPVVTFTRDSGATTIRAFSSMPSSPTALTFSVAAVPDHGGLLFASHSTSVYLSADAGCSWSRIVDADEIVEVVATGQWGYAVSQTGDRIYVFHIDGLVGTYDLPFRTRRIADSASEPGVIYALSRNGDVWRSSSHGVDWAIQGVSIPTSNSPGWLAINPHNPIHLVATASDEEPFVSFDGALSWHRSEGLRRGADMASVSLPHFGKTLESPELWVFTLRWFDDSEGIREERVIVNSTDGGITFQDSIKKTSNVRFTFPALTGIRQERGGLYFSGTGCPEIPPTLYRRSNAGTLTEFTYENQNFFGISAITTHPENSNIVYLGLRYDQSCQQF